MQKVNVKNVISLAIYLNSTGLSTGKVFEMDGDYFIETRHGDLFSFISGDIIEKRNKQFVTRLKEVKKTTK